MAMALLPGFCVCLVFCVLAGDNVVSAASLKYESNFGSDASYCAACTIGVGLLRQVAQVRNESIAKLLEQHVCTYFDKQIYREACEEIVNFTKSFISILESCHSPDVVCVLLDVCQAGTSSHQPVCHLFPVETNCSDITIGQQIVKNYLRKSGKLHLPPFCEWPGVKFFCEIIDLFGKLHKPPVDYDEDGFSTLSESLRGYAWRGRDCNDMSEGSHPGARPLHHDINLDSNCNGIKGVNHETGRPYEDELCSDSSPRGTMLVGDSAGAHFHVPPQYLDPHFISQNGFPHLTFAIEMEFDFPMMSSATGYKNLSWSIVDSDPVVSLYDLLRQRNRCNHRDYHNLGVNGARVSSLLKYFDNIKRNQSADYPVILVYEFVGNDVCNGHHDTIKSMTTTEQMRKAVLATLAKLDSTLPAGSHILMIGLADGRFLWESLHNRYHPLGLLNRDITYPQFYKYLTCLGKNPCNGWMSSNETLREFTSERAWNLSQVLKQIANESANKYRNFDISFVDCPLTPIIEQWEIEHGPNTGWQLIEPVDGFHPNQLANSLFAKYVWNFIEKNVPHFIGDVNPHNQKIIDLFGDQQTY